MQGRESNSEEALFVSEDFDSEIRIEFHYFRLIHGSTRDPLRGTELMDTLAPWKGMMQWYDFPQELRKNKKENIAALGFARMRIDMRDYFTIRYCILIFVLGCQDRTHSDS